ncbi:MAG: hypothetical protein IJ537_03020 [Bacteroidaceae bacterium]|nr:hypothetical protein [Bacteroidaceae bacterium]
MKKLFFLSIAVMCLSSTTIKAQEDADSKYIRNSLYMLKLDMIPENEEYEHAYEVMNNAFDGINFATRYERYNDFSLGSNRHIDWENIPEVTAAEMDAIEKESKKDQLIKAELQKLGVKVDSISEREYAARILKYFNENKYGNQLVAKWHVKNGESTDNVTAWDNELSVIMSLGMKGLSEEERSNALATGNINQVCGDSENKLLSTTYVCVNDYRMMTAKEKSATAIALAEVALQFLPGPAQLAGQAAVTAAKIAAEKTKGYFVKTNAYLFKLDWDQSKFDSFYADYWDKPAEFNTNANYQLKYVGKSSKFAGAGLTMKSGNVDELTARGALRATDAAFAALQRNYEEFRPMCTLHEEDGKLVAYIGKKEGIKAGDKFNVFLPEEGKDKSITWKQVGTIKVDKKAIWDNSEGAGKTIEGEAEDVDNKKEGEADSSLKYTVFADKPSKKIYGGLMIRLAK